jgi:hypothetical protein
MSVTEAMNASIVSLLAAANRQAVDVVTQATGTRPEFVRVSYDGLDGAWGWTVDTHVLTFATKTGKRKSGTGTLRVSGWSTISPSDAALGCVEDIERAVRGGLSITGGGRIEVAR